MKKTLKLEDAIGRVTELEVNLPFFAKYHSVYHWISDIQDNQVKGITIWDNKSISIDNYTLVDALKQGAVRIEANEFEYALSRAIGVIKGKIYTIREEVQP